MRHSLRVIYRTFDAIILGSPVVPVILIVLVLISLAT